MNVVITDWALKSYLDLKHKRVFTEAEYNEQLRPDAERLKRFPHDPKFRVNSFWGPATLGNGVNVRDGFKMKWDSIGSGKSELRLCVAIIGSMAFLCQAFTKKGKNDTRECLNLQRYINLIMDGRYLNRGRI